jgi:hypothetical protein
MSIFKGKERLALIVTVFLSVLITEGCATAIKYSYDTRVNFSEQKSYTWALSSVMDKQDYLLEINVQVLADQLLGQKGFIKVSENPDLMISMSYEFDSPVYQQDSYQLRMLNLNIYKIKRDVPSPSDMPRMSMDKGNTTEKKELVWRGTAFGTIDTNAASDDLKKVVQGILSNFPPK